MTSETPRSLKFHIAENLACISHLEITLLFLTQIQMRLSGERKNKKEKKEEGSHVLTELVISLDRVDRLQTLEGWGPSMTCSLPIHVFIPLCTMPNRYEL